MALGGVVDLGGRADDAANPAQVGLDADMRSHNQAPLLEIVIKAPLAITLFVLFLVERRAPIKLVPAP